MKESKPKKKIYEQVAEYIKAAIYSGEMKLGDAIYSENYLCEVLQVSRTSVRKAIRQMVEENILVSRPGVGTFVKASGQGAIHGSICLVNHYTRVLRYNMADSYYMDLIYGAEQEASLSSISFQIFSGPIVSEEDVVTKAGHLKTDGIIVDGCFQSYFEDLEFLSKISPNVVILDGNPEETFFPVVAPALEEPFRELCQIASARRRPVIFLYSEYASNRRWAKKCFELAAKGSDIEVIYVDYSKNIPRHLYYNIDHQYLIRHALEAVLRETIPGAVICACDHTATHVLRVLKTLNFKVPGDIAVSGVGQMSFSGMLEHDLTTIMVNPGALATMAVQRLMALVNAEKWDKSCLVKAPLLIKESF